LKLLLQVVAGKSKQDKDNLPKNSSIKKQVLARESISATRNVTKIQPICHLYQQLNSGNLKISKRRLFH
jgi:hypothetical protein